MLPQIVEPRSSASLDNIITSIPELSLITSSGSSMVPLPPSNVCERGPYNLRPRDRKDNLMEVFGGLGISGDPPLGPKQRGRKYNLLKAHKEPCWT